MMMILLYELFWGIQAGQNGIYPLVGVQILYQPSPTLEYSSEYIKDISRKWFGVSRKCQEKGELEIRN
jgi:hypothetical protein